MSLIFRRRAIKIYADAETVIKSLKETACNTAPNGLMNTFSDESFSYTMRGNVQLLHQYIFQVQWERKVTFVSCDITCVLQSPLLFFRCRLLF